jgi:exosortase
MTELYNRRTAGFLLFWLLSLAPFWTSISTLATLSTQDDRYSYVILMPVISLGLVLLHKKSIFAESRYCPGWGIPLFLAGSVLYVAAKRLESGLTVEILAVVLVWIAGFLLFYGTKAVRSAAIPLLALLCTAPLPKNLMHMAEVGLQYASADVSHAVFKLIGIPVFRNGLVFSLPGLNIEVAEQCSGIRSTTALLITVAMASHLFFRSNWSKLALIALTIPIAIFKNAVRITTLSWLGVYVSQDVLEGPLHRMGGLPFTMVAIAILAPLLLLFRRLETGASGSVGKSSSVLPGPAPRTEN